MSPTGSLSCKSMLPSYRQDCGNGAADGQCPNHIWQDINNSGSGKHPLIDKRDIGSCKDAQINSCIGNRDERDALEEEQ